MRLLLDTHAFLWALQGSDRLSDRARDAIHNPRNGKFVSYASLWEISLKVALGKLTLTTDWAETLRVLERLSPNTILPLRTLYLEHLLTMPHHHRDPFDRILIAQAAVEGLAIVTCDAAFDAYGVPLLW